MSKAKRILLVTEELSTIPPSGGIGAAFLELALALARFGHSVDILFTPAHFESIAKAQEKAPHLAEQGIRILTPDFEKYVHCGNDYSKKTYTVYRTIRDLGITHDVIHFHDYKGLGFATLEAKRCGLAFAASTIVVQTHGPTRWTIDANNSLFSHPDHLRIDHMERCSIEWADHLVSPSRYLLDWMVENDFAMPPAERRHVLPNVITGSVHRGRLLAEENAIAVAASEIVMFGRHEERKGLLSFLKAIRLLDERGILNGIRVTLLGGFSEIAGRHSGLVVTDMMKGVSAELRVIPNFNRLEAMRYLSERRGALVVIPSPEENLPYTVMEAMALGKPVLSSNRGGAAEIVDPAQHETHLFDPSPEGIAETLARQLTSPLEPTQFARAPETFEQDWLAFHARKHPAPRIRTSAQRDLPRVTFGITHYERPRKLLDAVWSALRQDYENMEIVVVDDGSTSAEAAETLDTVESVLKRTGGRVVRQKNAYLGAARNTVARVSSGDFLLYLDDDDLAFGHLVSTLVRAAQLTGADVINCPNLFMEAHRRREGVEMLEKFNQKVSMFPLGGPVSLGTSQNWFGAATALIRRDAFDRVGGYTELKDVGFEDFEFMLRVAQSGGRIEICPEPLYLYEVDRPSMISQTSASKNYRRIVNAIEISPNDRSIRDVLNVAAGSRAVEEQANRRRWEAKINEHADISDGLAKAGADPAAVFELLAQYADRTDAGLVRHTWTKLPSPDGTDDARWHAPPEGRTHRPFQAHAVAAADDVTGSVLTLALMGRPDDAVDLVEHKLDTLPYVTEAAVEWFGTTGEAVAGASATAFDRLCAAYLERPIAQDAAGKIIARAALCAFDKQMGLPMTVAELLKRYRDSERIYRKANPEVDDAIENRKILPDAMEHFRRHGHSEGRAGFEDFRVAARLLSDIYQPTQPWEICRHFGYDSFLDLSRGHAPTASFPAGTQAKVA